MNGFQNPEPSPGSDTLTEICELVFRAKARDAGALNALIRRHQNGLRSTVRRRLGADLRRHVESMDVVQDTFLKAVETIDRLEVRTAGSVDRWLARIATHVIYGYRDRYQADKRSMVREQPLDDTATHRGSGPGTTVIRHEEFETYLRRLSRLPKRQRDLVNLHLHDRLSWAEAARRTGHTSGDAARMCYQRARRRLLDATRSARSA